MGHIAPRVLASSAGCEPTRPHILSHKAISARDRRGWDTLRCPPMDGHAADQSVRVIVPLFVELPRPTPLLGAVKGYATCQWLAGRKISDARHLQLHQHPLTPAWNLSSDPQYSFVMVALSLLSLLLAPAVLAAPWRRDGFQGQCSVPASALDIPPSFQQLSGPPNFVLMGYGIQNYTCNANGAYV